MEWNTHTQERGRSKPTAAILWTVLASVFTALLPVGLVILPALWAYVMFRTRPLSLAPLAVLLAVSSSLLWLSWFAGVCLAALAALVAAALYVMQKRRLGNAYTVFAAAGVSLLALYCLVCLPGLVSGAGAFSVIQQAADAWAASMRALLPEALAGMSQETFEVYNEYLDVFTASITTFVVPALCIASGVLGLSNLLFLRLFAKRGGVVLPPMRPFAQWTLPRSMVSGLFALLIGALLLELFEWSHAAALVNTANALVGLPMTIQGLCVVDFIITRKGGNVAGRRAFVYIAVGLLFALLQMPLLILGCFEQVVRFRLRMTGGTPPAMNL